jgi:hypothetical protein
MLREKNNKMLLLLLKSTQLLLLLVSAAAASCLYAATGHCICNYIAALDSHWLNPVGDQYCHGSSAACASTSAEPVSTILTSLLQLAGRAFKAT